MGLVKTSVSIPEELLAQVRATSNNLSAVVTSALREYMRQKRVERAVKSFGCWEQREQESVEIVNEIRKTRKRNYASRSN